MKKLKIEHSYTSKYGQTSWWISGQPGARFIAKINEVDIRVRQLTKTKGTCTIRKKHEVGESQNISLIYVSGIKFPD